MKGSTKGSLKSGKTNSLHQIFTPKRKKGKTWDPETQSGYLWLWAGSFKRWKHMAFSCQQPGLLTYSGRQKKRGKKTSGGGSINLHGATVEASPTNSRMFTIRGPSGSKVYLRTTDAEDRRACIESIRHSGQTYGTLLTRASQLIGHAPTQEMLQKGLDTLDSNVQSSVKVAKIASNELGVAYELRERVKARMREVAPYKEAFQDHLAGIQRSLVALAASFSLRGSSDDDASFAADRERSLAGSPPPTAETLQPGGGSGNVGRRQPLDTTTLRLKSTLSHADSFQSALSELQRSPSWQDGSTVERGPFAEDRLSNSWGAYTAAVEEAVRSEATRVVELQAENEALKAGMRNFKMRAQSHARRLRALEETKGSASALGRHESSDSEDLDISHTAATPRQVSTELAPLHDARGLGEDTKGMSSSMGFEYRQALDALEAVQKHAFALNSQRGRQVIQELASDEPPPDGEGEVEYEDGGEGEGEGGSEDELKSEADSRPSTSLSESVWEIAAQRGQLPQPAPLQRGFSIWSVLKSAIGKDLTRITLPATINEPLSALQRVAEDLEYRQLLDQALAASDPAERLLLIAAFIASGYSATLSRESKPFNPLLGETFEWQSGDQSCRFLCEQVSHHPPVSCWWSEGSAGWQYWGEIELRSKFWGKSVEMMPTGTCWLKLGEELFSWNKANMTINNIILGTYWLDWHGTITITNHTSGSNAVLKFPKSSGRQLDHRGTLTATVTAPGVSHPQLELQGKFTESMKIVPLGSSAVSQSEREVFRINEPAEQGSLQYNMTRMAMTLNTAEPELLRQLPPTDSRFRPDQRALEDGVLDRATEEKLRLEEKQRQARKERKEMDEAIFPCWFKLHTPSSQQEKGADHWLGSDLVRLPGQDPPCMWQFTGAYWDAKQRQDWGRCPDIYSGGPEPSLPSPEGSKS